MKAVVRDKYGSPDVLRFEDIPKPVPGDDEVLVQVRAASINTADLDHLRGRPRIARGNLTKPRARVLGFDMAGTVEAVGRNVTRFGPGDEVWADLFPSGGGAFAEYVSAGETAFVPKPESVPFEVGATVPHSGLLALQALRSWGGVQSGQRVLVNGGGGCVGPFVIQLAKAFGAKVTGVDETGKLDLMKAAGADHVIDYTRESFTEHKGGYDRIVDIAANRWVLANRRALAAMGTYVQIARSLSGFFGAVAVGGLVTLVGDKRMGIFMWEPNRLRDLDFMAGLIEEGSLRPIIDRRVPLPAVPEALRYQESGAARGKLVIVP